MPIEPVGTALDVTGAIAAKLPQAPATVPFVELLSRGGVAGQQVSQATAAEVFRLKMLHAAVSVVSDDEKPRAMSAGVQGLLDRFLEQLPEHPVERYTAAPAEAEETSTLPLSLETVIGKASRRYGVDGGLIKAIIKAESDFNVKAVSPSGAQGLMQLMPATARGLGVKDPFDPEQNVMAGTRFLKDMLQRYGGNLDEALAAYNWGPGNVDRHGTGTLPHETRLYLEKVKSYYNQYAA